MKKIVFRGIFATVLLLSLIFVVVRAECNTTIPDSSSGLIEAKLTALDGVKGNSFGNSVSIYGNTAIVGDTKVNAVYVFTHSGITWTQQAKLTAPDGVEDNYFGGLVSLYGDTAVIGAEYANVVYVFTRSSTIWTQQAILTAVDSSNGNKFSVSSFSLYKDTIIIGTSGGVSRQGEAYIFTRSGTTWTQQTKLTSQNDTTDNYSFGCSVALYEDTAIVGAVSAEASYVFTRNGTTWIQQAELSAIDGIGGDCFGSSVSLFEDTVVIGAFISGGAAIPDNWAGPGGGASSGAAYIFTRSGTTWTQQIKLTQLYGIAAANLNTADLAGFLNGGFGSLVSLYGDTVIISGSASTGGSVFVFTRGGATWARQIKLTAPKVKGGDLFGTSVSIYEDKAIIGFPGNSDLQAPLFIGSAYVFDVSNKQ